MIVRKGSFFVLICLAAAFLMRFLQQEGTKITGKIFTKKKKTHLDNVRSPPPTTSPTAADDNDDVTSKKNQTISESRANVAAMSDTNSLEERGNAPSNTASTPPPGDEPSKNQTISDVAKNDTTAADKMKQQNAFSISVNRTESSGPDSAPTVPTIYYPFIRIPKTGSTSMLYFLHEYSGLRPLSAYLPLAEMKNQHPSYTCCAFGSLPSNVTTGRGNCAHYNYQQHLQMMKGLKKYLPGSQNVTLRPFTIVREPFEQMQSLFYYTKRVNWEFKSYSNETKKLIESGDLEGYLKLRSKKKGPKPLTTASAQQWQFLNRTNINAAIKAVQTGEVVVVLNECFEASLRLLEHLYLPVKEDAVDEFLASPNFSTNKGTYDHSNAALHEKIRTWYALEYQFYEAVVEKFHQLWNSTGLDAALLQHKCVYL
jgi:hypothetical protein